MLLGAAMLWLDLAGPAPALAKDPAEARGPGAAEVAAGEIKDVAELLPEDTLAFLELREPGQVSKDVAALLKGSALDDMPAVMARLRERLGNDNRRWQLMEVAGYTMFLSPEMIAEAGRLRGAAVAVTGFTKEREPVVVGIVLSGESQAPTFFLRVYLTMDQVYKVADVGGVALYRARHQDFAVKQIPGQPPPPPVVRDSGPTFALLPHAVVIGSTPESVKDVVLRAQGKSKNPSLAGHRDFTAAARLRERPGLFGYANLTGFGGKLDEIVKAEPGLGAASWAMVLKEWVNLKAFRTAVASLTLQRGSVDLQARVSFDPKESSPVLGFLPQTKGNLELLHFAPKDSVFAATRSVSDGEKMWDRAMKLADAFAKETGAPGPAPSEQIGQAEKALDVRFGKDVLGKMRGVGLVVNFRGGLPERGPWMPMFVVEAVDDDAVKSFEDLLPRLAGLAGGEAPKPSTEQIQGQRIFTIAGERVPWGLPLSYGHRGQVLVLGPDGKLVADALSSGVKKEGLLGVEKVAAAVKDLDEPVAVGVGSLGRLLVALPALGTGEAIGPGGIGAPKAVPDAPPPPPIKRGAARRAPAGDFLGIAEDDDPPPPAQPKAGAEAEPVKELLKAVEPLPPFVISLSRKPDSLVLEVRQAELKTASAKVIDALIELGFQRALGRGGARFKVGAAPPPPPPPAIK
jgi:hypothetical protein